MRLLSTLALLLAFGLLSGPASAERDGVPERYGVQVASFRDYDQALALIETLEREGYGAYSEFFMLDGLQYVRVRVGCFSDAAGAEELASLLLLGAADEAVVVPLTDEPVLPCLVRELGFLTPEDWGAAAMTDSAVVFWTQVGELRGFVAFDGASWQVVQAEEVSQEGDGIAIVRPGGGRDALLAAPATGLAVRFEAASDPERVVARGVQNGDSESVWVISSGRLLWRSPRAAVAQLGDAVFSLRFEESR